MTYPREEQWRESLHTKIQTGLEQALAHAQAQLDEYKQACPYCRMLNDALIRRFAGSAYIYDFALVNKGTCKYCPKCDRCVWCES